MRIIRFERMTFWSFHYNYLSYHQPSGDEQRTYCFGAAWWWDSGRLESEALPLRHTLLFLGTVLLMKVVVIEGFIGEGKGGGK